MDIGIGIPNAVPGASGPLLLEWAHRADALGFFGLATIGAVSYPSYEELTVLAAAAAVTERIGLMTNVLIGPARSTAELAKQAATVQQLSDGRLTLGLGVGWRESDYTIAGREFGGRGRAFEEQLAGLRRAWAGEALTQDSRPPSPDPGRSGVPLLVGGFTDAAVRRAVEHGDGWAAGGAPPDMVGGFVEKVHAAWTRAGRNGSPRCTGLAYFALGDVEEQSRASVLDYYAPMGTETAEMIAGGVLRTPEAIRGAIDAYAAAGVDELYLDPTVASLEQVERLAEVAL